MRLSNKILSGLALSGSMLITPSHAPAQSGPSARYFYDDARQLVKVVDSSGNVVTYAYDPVGNVLSISRASVASGALAVFNLIPQRGVAGTAVTIQGQGFSSIPANNAVLFNGTAATVASATATALVVTVPAGATTGPISVTVAGVTAQGEIFTVIPTLLSISLTPANSSLSLGNSVQFTAIGRYTDGSTQDLTPSAAWQSSNAATASISPLNGMAKGVGIGSTTISATSGSVTGSTALTVISSTLASILLTPANFVTGPASSLRMPVSS